MRSAGLAQCFSEHGERRSFQRIRGLLCEAQTFVQLLFLYPFHCIFKEALINSAQPS